MPIGQLYKKIFTLALQQAIDKKNCSCNFTGFRGKLIGASLLAIVLRLPSSAQTILVDPAGNGGFETGTTWALNGWTAVNGPFNQWYVGTIAAGYYSGARGVCIQQPANTYAYTNFAGTNHFYRVVTIANNTPNITLSFQVH